MRSTACVLLLVSTACSDDGALGPEAAGMPSTEDGASAATEAEGAAEGRGDSESDVALTSDAGATGASDAGGTTTSVSDAGGTTTPVSDAGDGSGSGGEAADGPAEFVRLPVADAPFDYQLGGAYEPPEGVEIVSRDRTDPPAAGLYNLCYVNGFQSQPHEESWWLEQHPDLLLRDEAGEVVIDPDWDEILLDIRTQAARTALADVVGAWIEQCAADGFDAVEIDNLDTYARSGGLVSQDDAVAYMSLLSARAHDVGLAIAQKNSAELLDRRDEIGTDFVVAEECNVYDECQDYRDVYGDLVFVIEYDRGSFETGCSAFPGLSIVLRDLNLVTPTNDAYVYDGC